MRLMPRPGHQVGADSPLQVGSVGRGRFQGLGQAEHSAADVPLGADGQRVVDRLAAGVAPGLEQQALGSPPLPGDPKGEQDQRREQAGDDRVAA